METKFTMIHTRALNGNIFRQPTKGLVKMYVHLILLIIDMFRPYSRPSSGCFKEY